MFRRNPARLFCTAMCAAVLFMGAAPAFAQGNGTISGTVTDQTGAVIANATVKVVQAQTGLEMIAESNSDGVFVFPALHPSKYSLSVTKPGFRSQTQTGIPLQADQALTVNVRLEVGSVTNEIIVTESVLQVDTTTGTLSQVIDERRVVDLPLNGRNAAALITLVAGVVDAANEGNGVDQGVGKTFPAAVVTSSNGTLPNQSNYLLNGGNNVDEMTNANAPFPMPDAVQEFSVQTSNYNAEYGQSAGAMVNVILKSGTSSFHGSAFEFLRNGYFNAKNYFATKADTMHRNQFGGTVGGPVIIPHLSKGKKTQFFYGYQRTMVHASSTANQTTAPTMAEEGRSGTGYADFGNLCTAGWNASNLCNTASQRILNPFTNAAYPLNRIPSSDFDPAAVELQKHFPTFSGTEAAGKIGGVVNFLRPSIQDFNEHTVRVDHQFSPKDQIFGHYFYDYFSQPGVYDPDMLSSYQSYFSTRYQNALVSESHIFSNTLLNTLTLNYQRATSLRGGPPASQNITGYGVTNIWQPGTGPYMAATITGYFGASSSAFAGWYRNNYTLDDGLHWVKGNHNLAFGGHVESSKFDVTNVYQSYGGFGFGTFGSYINAYANFLLGFMTSFQQGNYELVNDRNHFPSLYVQDSWRATRKLTLNYGVRWELFAPWHNKIGNLQLFDPAAYAANKGTGLFTTLPAGLLLTGDPGVPKDGTDKANKFMPRFGFAYDILGDGKTVVRGGAGVFYQDRLPGFFNLNQAANVPNTVSVGLTNPGMYSATPGANPGGPFSNPYCVGGCGAKGTPYANPFPFTLPFASNKVFPNQILVDQYDPNFAVPVTYAYNLTVERQLGPSWAARLAYVASASRHQFVNLELNPAVNTGSGLNANARRPYNTAPTVGPCTTMTGCSLSYSQIVTTAMIGSAAFHSLQATLDKKMSHGLYLLANVTWSKTTDDLPQVTRVNNTENLNAGESYVYPWYPANATGIPAAARVSDIKALDRGLSDIDHPLVFSLSYSWDLPKLRGGNRFLESVVNGWRISGLALYRSGDSLTSWVGTDRSLTGLGQDRGQYDATKPMYYSDAGGGASNCTAGKSCVQWFNPAAFSIPVSAGPGTGFGNVVKGSLRGPARTNWDASVTRSFRVWRETHLDFRVEYFNLLNHTQLRNPQMATSNATFGTINSAYDPRIAQFALKYVF